jgi:hypothetical protein
MKKITHVFLALFIALAMLAAGPVITARADCTENAATDPDEWTCSGADTDGMTVDTADDVVNVDPGASVTNTAGDVTTIETIDGTLTNNGNIFNTEDVGTALYSSGDGDITNNGQVEANGLLSTGILTLNGDIVNDGTVTANGFVGTGVFTENGDVTNNDTISAGSDIGTAVYTGGGDNTVTNNGNIFATGSDGIAIVTSGGNDTVTLNSGSTTSGDTTAICTCDGDDTVTINEGATVNGAIDAGVDNDTVTINEDSTINGIINGGDGNDTLQFGFFTQSELDLLDPVAGFLTYNGQYYEWINFEQLLGLFVPAPTPIAKEKNKDHDSKGPRVYFRTEDGLGLGSEDELGINVFADPGLIAFIPFASLSDIDLGEEGVRFQVPNSQDWYVVVVNLGPYEFNKSHDLYQVSIFNKDDILISDEQSFDY